MRRSQFCQHKLIFKDEKWLSPDDCIWETSVEIPGRTQLLCDDYVPLMDFFVQKLGIVMASLETFRKEWTRVAQMENGDVEAVKRIMQELSRLLAPLTQEDAKAKMSLNTVSAPHWPVRGTTGSVELVSKETDFFIADNPRYGKELASEIRLLDFSLSELPQIMPLLRSLNMDGHLLSKNVEEFTVLPTAVEGLTIDHARTSDLRQRAYALSRYVPSLDLPAGSSGHG